MIVCVNREEKQTYYYEPLKSSIWDAELVFVVRSETLKHLMKELPMEGILMRREEFEEKFYVPSN